MNQGKEADNHTKEAGNHSLHGILSFTSDFQLCIQYTLETEVTAWFTIIDDLGMLKVHGERIPEAL